MKEGGQFYLDAEKGKGIDSPLESLADMRPC